MKRLELLEQTGILQSLILLLEKQRYITELRRTSVNPVGIASQDALTRIRQNLTQLGLITEEIEEGLRPRTFLVITDKGRRVAQKLKDIQEVLDE